MRLDRKIIEITSFLILLLTYIHAVHAEDSVIYGFPFGYVTIYLQSKSLLSSFNINILLLLSNFIIIYLIIFFIKKIKCTFITKRK